MTDASGRLWDRAERACLFATVAIVPLVFSPALRSFAAAKLAALEIGVGVAWLCAGFGSRAHGRGHGLAIALAIVGFASAMRPDVEGVRAAAYLIALAVLTSLLRDQPGLADSPTRRWVLGPALVVAALAALQIAGIGVLAATRAAFGGAHGVVVATLGNPVELGWYAVLIAAIALDQWRGAPAIAAIAVAAVVIAVDRARMAALGLAWVAIAAVRRPTPRMVLGAIAIAGVVAVVLGAWDGATAVGGRWFLVRIAAGLVVDGAGIPAGPGAFARDAPAAQAAAIARSPDEARFASDLDHAHCDPLELAYELGLPGVLGIAALVVAIARAPGRRTAGMPLAIAGLFGTVGYPWFSPGCAVICAWCLAIATSGVATRSLGLGRRALAIVGGAALAFVGLRQLAAEHAITDALSAHARGDDVAGEAAAERALALWPGADAWAVRGNFALARGDADAAVRAYRAAQALRPRTSTAANLARAETLSATAAGR